MGLALVHEQVTKTSLYISLITVAVRLRPQHFAYFVWQNLSCMPSTHGSRFSSWRFFFFNHGEVILRVYAWRTCADARGDLIVRESQKVAMGLAAADITTKGPGILFIKHITIENEAFIHKPDFFHE